MTSFSEKIKSFLLRLFSLNSPTFSQIVLSSGTAENIMEFANKNYPKEFVSLLRGEIKDGKLIIDGLYYLPFQSSKKAAFITYNIPTMNDLVGSVHSHPSRKSGPSETDLRFFNKRGAVHMIISYPYEKEDIACYGLYGDELEFSIMDVEFRDDKDRE